MYFSFVSENMAPCKYKRVFFCCRFASVKSLRLHQGALLSHMVVYAESIAQLYLTGMFISAISLRQIYSEMPSLRELTIDECYEEDFDSIDDEYPAVVARYRCCLPLK